MPRKKNQIIISVLSICSFILYLVVSVLGYFPIGSFWNWISDGYIEENIYNVGLLSYECYCPEIGVIMTIFFAIILILFIFKFFNLKYKSIKQSVVLGGIVLIFALSISFFIDIIERCYNLYTIGIVIVCLIGLSTILNFFDICFRIKEFTQMTKNKTSKKIKKEEKSQYDEAIKKLRALKQLYDDGAITEEEYKEKKEKYIEYI